MGTDDDNNKYTDPEKTIQDNKERAESERRLIDRRITNDRRTITRFSDVLGRRSGVDRRLPVR